jgi:hypothetical protein
MPADWPGETPFSGWRILPLSSYSSRTIEQFGSTPVWRNENFVSMSAAFHHSVISRKDIDI